MIVQQLHPHHQARVIHFQLNGSFEKFSNENCTVLERLPFSVTDLMSKEVAAV